MDYNKNIGQSSNNRDLLLLSSIEETPDSNQSQSAWWAYFKDKRSILLAQFLILCVCTYKGIIPYNEEILVALSFFAFVLFCFKYLGDTIQESLNERSAAIKNELQNLLCFKRDSLQELHKEHEKIAHLRKTLPAVNLFTRKRLSKYDWSVAPENIKQTLGEQLCNKLAQLATSKPMWQDDSYKSICKSTHALVLTRIWSQKANKKKKECLYLGALKQAINYIKI